MKKIINVLKTQMENSVPNIISASIVFIVGMILVKLSRKFINRVANRIHTTEAVRSFVINIVNVALIVSVSIVSLSTLGIPVGTFAAIFGAIGVGISIVFKESLSNLGAGFLLIFITKPFQINDYIAVSSAEGTVGGINLFSTALKTTDNKVVMIPNSKLLNESIINYSNELIRRIDINFHIELDTNSELLIKTINNTLAMDERILTNPKPIIGIKKISPLGLYIIIAPWVKTQDYWDTYYDLIINLKNSFEKNNIKITSTYKKI